MSVSVTFAVKAQQLLEEGNAGEAIQLCRQGLDAFPNYVTAYLILARACIAVGDYVAAEEALERGLQKAPRSNTARTLRKEVQYALRFKTKSSETTADNAVGGAATALAQSGAVPSGLQSALAEASVAATFINEGRDIPDEQAEKTLGNYLRIIETDKATSQEAQSSFRSTNLRLIPGLDFTPLRVESSPHHTAERQRNAGVPEPPPLTEFADWEQYQASLRNDTAVELPLDADSAVLLKPQTGYSRPPMPTPRFSIREIEELPTVEELTAAEVNDIDNLAARLMQAQMPDVKELLNRAVEIPQYLQENAGETVSDDQAQAGTVIVSEMMAKIYEAQGAFTQALYVYQSLETEATAQKNEEKRRFYAERINAVQAHLQAM